MARKRVGLKLEEDMLARIEAANGNRTRTSFIEKALRAALPEKTEAKPSGWCPEPGSKFYRSPAECLAGERSENEWHVESIEENTTHWQASFDAVRLELREERRELEAVKPKWTPPP